MQSESPNATQQIVGTTSPDLVQALKNKSGSWIATVPSGKTTLVGLAEPGHSPTSIQELAAPEGQFNVMMLADLQEQFEQGAQGGRARSSQYGRAAETAGR